MDSAIKPRKPRTVHSRRDTIRDVIARRLAAGQPLTVREILKDSGGGSTDTVRDELQKITASDGRIAEALKGHALRSPAEEVQALRLALDASLQREASLRGTVNGYEKIIAGMTETIDYLVARHDDTYRQMIARADSFTQASKAIPALKTAIESAPKERVRIEPDIVLEAKYTLQVQENAALHRKVRELQSLLPRTSPPDYADGLSAPGSSDEDIYE